MNPFIVFFGKTFSIFSKLLNLGHGSTWPGHIALKLNPNFINDSIEKSKTKIILITGTNGKTTTSKLIETIFTENDKTVFINSSGANLLNGVASSVILNSNYLGKIDKDFAIFEIDENTLPQITKEIEPDFIIALNLFRDQLDRYGELDSIVKKWKEAYSKLKKTKFILNADDPQIAYLGENLKSRVSYFGLNDNEKGNNIKQHASDSILCPKCGNRLEFDMFYFSHLGKYSCLNCGLKRPKLTLEKFNYYPLNGLYAVYDTLAAVLLSKMVGIKEEDITKALKKFKPAFGRQEKVTVEGKNVQFFLSKNPTSFNESLRTINEQAPKNLLIVLNDRIPDGTDVSWIWDVDFETLVDKKTNLYISGDRVYDLALRIKYAGIEPIKENIFENLESGITKALKNTGISEILYILPTYSAMLQARKILTGKKIS